VINFQFGGVDFTLDTDKGELLGDKSTAQYKNLIEVVGEPSKYDDKTIYGTLGGEPSSPFDCVEIINPYKDPKQFSLMIVLKSTKNNWDISDDMRAYLPYYQEEKIVKDLRELGATIYY
jgi:hypothetical protein